MQKVKAATLMLDYDLYPRHQINSQHVNDIRRAMEAGHNMPAVVADRKSKRVIDGFHRVTAALKNDEAIQIQVEWRDYKSDRDMFLDAVVLNAEHGEKLTPFDRARCLTRGEELKIDVVDLAAALHITVASLEDLRARKVAIGTGGEPTPIKLTGVHLAGERMSKRQQEGMVRAGGPAQLFFVNQVINLIESNLVDQSNQRMMERLEALAGILAAFLKHKQAA